MSDTLRFYEEIDLRKIVDEQVRKLQRNVDEATLDKAADTLASFGYVKADGKNRWFELFGTPERAVRTLIKITTICKDYFSECTQCPLYKAPSCSSNLEDDDYDTLLEWLKGDADDTEEAMSS